MNLHDEQPADHAPPGVDVILGLGVTGLSCTRWLAARGREVRRGAGVLLRRGSVQDGDGPLDGVAENSIGELSAPAEKTFDRRRSRCV